MKHERSLRNPAIRLWFFWSRDTTERQRQQADPQHAVLGKSSSAYSAPRSTAGSICSIVSMFSPSALDVSMGLHCTVGLGVQYLVFRRCLPGKEMTAILY